MPLPNPLPARTRAALDEIERSIEEAWARYLRAHADADPEEAALAIVEDPTPHPWRLFEGAIALLTCPECDEPLGTGRRGCLSCDRADGLRFAAREVDRPGVPAGNEHALRVGSAVLRTPHRYPDWAVAGDALYVPLFLEGQMPTRDEQLAILAASKRASLDLDLLSHARTFRELAELATAMANRSIPGAR